MAIAIPFVVAVSGIAFVDGFDLLAVAIVCFWIMLWAQTASSGQMVRAAGVEPA